MRFARPVPRRQWFCEAEGVTFVIAFSELFMLEAPFPRGREFAWDLG